MGFFFYEIDFSPETYFMLTALIIYFKKMINWQGVNIPRHYYFIFFKKNYLVYFLEENADVLLNLSRGVFLIKIYINIEVDINQSIR